MRHRPFVVVVLLVWFVGAFGSIARVHAQQPATPAPAAAPAPAPAKPAAPADQSAAAKSAPPAPEAYTYSPDGRRDPFISLIGSGVTADPRLAGNRREGPAGLGVNEISVRGILQSRGAYVAMIQGPDAKTYIVHQGDKLLDGTIKSVTPQGLVLIQEVTDPLSLVKQREVSKLLRSVEGVK